MDKVMGVVGGTFVLALGGMFLALQSCIDKIEEGNAARAVEYPHIPAHVYYVEGIRTYSWQDPQSSRWCIHHRGTLTCEERRNQQ